MPCGCFGGGGKKKGLPRGSEGPPKPPKLLAEEPIERQTVLAQTNQPESLPLNGKAPGPGNGQIANENLMNDTTPTTPQSEQQSIVDGGSTKSSGARSRAELYAKRREFFRPLYDVSLTGSTNQRFATPRSSNTLPARGKRGAYLIGDGNGYFTAEGRYVSTGNEQNPENSVRHGGSGEYIHNEVEGGTNFATNDGQYTDNDSNTADRPPRPISQPSGVAGQWEEIMDEEPNVPQDEFHQKHQQIIQHQQHTPSAPPPPPVPKQINPHFIEFKEKHHKILNDPDIHVNHRSNDTEFAQKLAENRLTELDKLHNEVQEHYSKKMENGPVDVDSLVQKYTEDRWRKMVDIWESEGLVVEGGMVVVDDQGNTIEREMKANDDGSQVVENVTHIVERIGDHGEKITERIEKDGNTTVKVVETEGEYQFGGDGSATVKHTEEILVESFVQKEPSEAVTVTTIITPPTPQFDINTRVTPLANVEVKDVEDVIEFEQQYSEVKSTDYSNEMEIDSEPLVELIEDDKSKNIQQVIERERIIEQQGDEDEDIMEDSSMYRVSAPPSPVPTAPEQPVLPSTCTPPPSPQRDHEMKGSPTMDNPVINVCSSSILTEDTNGDDAHLVLGKSSATPPPSPPLQVSEQES